MTLYHGTDAVLQPGDVLRPGAQLGRSTWEYGTVRAPRTDDPQYVWVTPLLENAILLSGPAAHAGDLHVYEVEPLTETTVPDGETHNYVCGTARIVRLALTVNPDGDVLYEAADT